MLSTTPIQSVQSSDNYQGGSRCLNTYNHNTYSLRPVPIIDYLQGSSVPSPYGEIYNSTRLPPVINGNYTLTGSDFWQFDDDAKINGNAIFLDKSRLLVEHATVIFNGTIRASGETLIELRESIINYQGNCTLSGNAELRAIDSSETGKISCVDNSRLTLNDSLVTGLSAVENAIIYMWNSSIIGVTNLSECLNDDAIIYKDIYIIDVRVSVNNLSLPLHIKCYSSDGHMIISTFSQKTPMFTVVKETITSSNTKSVNYCDVTVQRGGLNQSRRIFLNGTNPYLQSTVLLLDLIPPQISDITQKEVSISGQMMHRIRATVKDSGIGVKDVTIRYMNGSEEKWNDIPWSLYTLGNDSFECLVPAATPGDSIFYYIVAYDLSNNKATSSIMEAPSPPEKQEAVPFLLIVFSLSVVIAVCVWVWAVFSINRRRKK
jgi:hypothetical protein